MRRLSLVAARNKQSPIAIFESNMADADQLLALTSALSNQRKRKMRRELRESVGSTLGIRKRDWDDLDCVESQQAFLILKPSGGLKRDGFDEDALRPLLRQAVVAIAAAVETYVADQACSMIGRALCLDPIPKRLREVSVPMGDVLTIDRQYTRRGWGYRGVLADHFRQEASASPSKIGMVFSTVGVEKLWPSVDKARGVKKGLSCEQMEELAERRNRIAHSADWVGRGRAVLSPPDVGRFSTNAREIVEAIDSVLPG